jgi:hypothetical protein
MAKLWDCSRNCGSIFELCAPGMLRNRVARFPASLLKTLSTLRKYIKYINIFTTRHAIRLLVHDFVVGAARPDSPQTANACEAVVCSYRENMMRKPTLLLISPERPNQIQPLLRLGHRQSLGLLD